MVSLWEAVSGFLLEPPVPSDSFFGISDFFEIEADFEIGFEHDFEFDVSQFLSSLTSFGLDVLVDFCLQFL